MPQHDAITPNCKYVRNLQTDGVPPEGIWIKPDCYIILLAANPDNVRPESAGEVRAMSDLFEDYERRIRKI